jgi:hypothetical protein
MGVVWLVIKYFKISYLDIIIKIELAPIVVLGNVEDQHILYLDNFMKSKLRN